MRNGHLKIWVKALEETGYDATRITDNWRYDGISDLFEPPQEKSSVLMAPLKVVGSMVYLTVSSIM
jgi:hypothetical protein